MSSHIETGFHPAIHFSTELFRETPYIHENGPHVMEEGMEYVLQNGANCQLFANFTESAVHSRYVPEYMRSLEKFMRIDNLYIDVEDYNTLQPGDVFLFGRDDPQFDPRELHQAVFTGLTENVPVLVHMVGNRINRRPDGSIIQKKPGPRIWPLSKFDSYTKYEKLFGVRRLNPDSRNVLRDFQVDQLIQLDHAG